MKEPGFKRFRESVAQRWAQAAGRPLWHAVGEVELELPAEHLLPKYQAVHRHYDRFLPHLAGHLHHGDVVIDVGANCGDTLAAMRHAKSDLAFVCIEPDTEFFGYLKRNAARLEAARPAGPIHLVQSLVGKQIGAAVLNGAGGTRSAAAAGSDAMGMAPRPLDDIVAELGQDLAARVRLLKSDVDGWDHDVLDSATVLLRNATPLLFFECQPTTDEQLQGMVKTVSALGAQGYVHFFVFDNYGCFMMRCDGVSGVHQLIAYVWQQQIGRATRTIHYFDLLVCIEADLPLARGVVDAYMLPTA